MVFEIVSDQPFRFENNCCVVRNIKWTMEKELNFFLNFDISIMPLDDSLRAKCKAGYKAIQSLAAGIPVVVSAEGYNKDIIDHGVNGFLAHTPDEFYDYIRCLIEDEFMLKKMKNNARTSVDGFDYSNWAAIYANAILDKII